MFPEDKKVKVDLLHIAAWSFSKYARLIHTICHGRQSISHQNISSKSAAGILAFTNHVSPLSSRAYFRRHGADHLQLRNLSFFFLRNLGYPVLRHDKNHLQLLPQTRGPGGRKVCPLFCLYLSSSGDLGCFPKKALK